MLPQGFWDSPHIFGEALSHYLKDLHHEGNTILQYVDDLLICSPIWAKAQEHIIQVLNFLANHEYKVFKTKAQLVQN